MSGYRCTPDCWTPVECVVCGRPFSPIGRSVALEAASGYCDPQEPPNLVLGALARGGRNCLACGRAAREVSRLRSLGKTVTPDERQRISDRKFAALTGLTICDCEDERC